MRGGRVGAVAIALAFVVGTPAAGSAAEDNRWIDVSGLGWITMDNYGRPTQYGAIPKPGLVITSDPRSDGDRTICTLGPAVHSSNDGDGFLTAGHCNKDGPMHRLQADAEATEFPPYANPTDTFDGIDTTTGTTLDYSAMWGGLVGPDAVRIAGTWPVAGVMALTTAVRLPEGTQVCFDGTVSGVRCGPLRDTDLEGLLQFGTVARTGDSGGPVFLVDGTTNSATLIGMVKGTNRVGFWTTATYLEPTLARMGAEALVDPAASAAVAGDPDYSARATPLR